jgi:hypothetical protein
MSILVRVFGGPYRAAGAANLILSIFHWRPTIIAVKLKEKRAQPRLEFQPARAFVIGTGN